MIGYVGLVVTDWRSMDSGGVPGADGDALPVRWLLIVGRPDEGGVSRSWLRRLESGSLQGVGGPGGRGRRPVGAHQ